MKNTQGIVALTVATACVGLVPFAQAQTVIGNFETSSLDGWGTNGGPGSPTYAQSTVGVTLGNYSLATVAPSGAYWGPSTGNLVADSSLLAQATQLSYDLTLNSTALNGGSGNFSGYAQDNTIAVQLFSPSTGSNLNLFMQESFSAAGLSDSSGQNATWSGVDGTRHIVWDLTKFTATDPVGGGTKTLSQFLNTYKDFTSVQIDFVQQIGGGSPVAPGTFYWDNVAINAQAAPEPMSLSFLGLGALALLKKKLRK